MPGRDKAVTTCAEQGAMLDACHDRINRLSRALFRRADALNEPEISTVEESLQERSQPILSHNFFTAAGLLEHSQSPALVLDEHSDLAPLHARQAQERLMRRLPLLPSMSALVSDS